MSVSRRKRVWLSTLSVLMTGLLTVPYSITPAYASTYEQSAFTQDALQHAFEQASQEFGVPLSILMSVSYNESRWDHHDGQPSSGGGYGVMHLTQTNLDVKGDIDDASVPAETDPTLHTLDTAASLLGLDAEVLKQDIEQNVRGGAALLAEYARETVGSLPIDSADWYGAVAKYSGSDEEVVAKDFANEVYATIQLGAERTTPSGQHVVLAAEAVTPNTDTSDSLHLRNTQVTGTDCPNGLACRSIPAAYKQYSSSKTDYGNYDIANRPEDGGDIRYIIIHDVEGSYESAIKTFLSKSYVTSHYVIRSSDGQITEMVNPKDVAWHAGNWYINSHSIGIEHSGVAVEGATWYSEQMYHASARLVKYLAERYNVPLDRQHILGHDDLPGLAPSNQSSMHWDPGAFWDWGHYFDLLGASFNPSNGTKNSKIVTIDVNFKTNELPLKYGSRDLELQPSNFVYLRTAPSADAPLISDPALHPKGDPGTTQIYDWGDKATIGQSFFQADRLGDWTAIYFGGQKAWFYNPNGKNTVPGGGILITPKLGKTYIPIYGAAFPENAAYDQAGIPRRTISTLQYKIPAGQVYVSAGAVQSDYFYAKIFNAPDTYKVVKGNDEYYQISFNHRIAFVKKSDVDVVTN